MKSRFIILIGVFSLLLILLLATITALFPDNSIDSYEDCKAKDYPIIWYFPKTCKAADGRIFEKQGGCYLGDFECPEGFRCFRGSCIKK